MDRAVRCTALGLWVPIRAARWRSRTTDVLVKYTYYGDANLDGVVNASSDYDLWAAGLASSGSLTGWEFGDFDYDGTINAATDYDLWSAGFAASQSAPLSSGVQPVPEPSTLILAALGFVGLALAQHAAPPTATADCSRSRRDVVKTR